MRPICLGRPTYQAMELSSTDYLASLTRFRIWKEEFCNNKPILPVLDVLLLRLYLLFFNDFSCQATSKKLVTLGSCLDFFVGLGA